MRSRGARLAWAAWGLPAIVAVASMYGRAAWAGESDPAATAPSPPAAERGAAPAPRGGRPPSPEAMVLCRGPRGTVYARDVEVGCRNQRLEPSNLVDFGAGDGCLLRRARQAGADGESAGAARGCDAVCRAAGDGRECIVALRRMNGDWKTFGPGEPLDAGRADSGEPIAVCCKR